jgi:hypothetical protein
MSQNLKRQRELLPLLAINNPFYFLETLHIKDTAKQQKAAALSIVL